MRVELGDRLVQFDSHRGHLHIKRGNILLADQPQARRDEAGLVDGAGGKAGILRREDAWVCGQARGVRYSGGQCLGRYPGAGPDHRDGGGAQVVHGPRVYQVVAKGQRWMM